MIFLKILICELTKSNSKTLSSHSNRRTLPLMLYKKCSCVQTDLQSAGVVVRNRSGARTRPRSSDSCMNPEFHLDIAGFSVFLSLSIGLVCCLTFVLLVGLWVFTFSLSLLSSVLLLLVTCVFLLVSFPSVWANVETTRVAKCCFSAR